MEPDVFWEEPSFDADDSAGGFVGRPPPGGHKCAAETSHTPPASLPSFLVSLHQKQDHITVNRECQQNSHWMKQPSMNTCAL